MATNTQGSFNDLQVAHDAFQDALKKCTDAQIGFQDNQGTLRTVYNGGADSSSAVFQQKMKDWDAQFTLVKGALARMTLELANSTEDYQKNEDVNAEIAAAITSKLVG